MWFFGDSDCSPNNQGHDNSYEVILEYLAECFNAVENQRDFYHHPTSPLLLLLPLLILLLALQLFLSVSLLNSSIPYLSVHSNLTPILNLHFY
jgi:hypothetical protein